MGRAYPDTSIKYVVGTLPDGRVVMDFRMAKVDHLKFTREEALELAEGLVEAVNQANAGITTRGIMFVRVFLFFTVLLSGCAHQDVWTTGDTVLYGIALATMAADAHMTTKIQDHPNIIENGTIAAHVLGPNPATDETWLYMTTVAVSTYFIARALPKGLRDIFLGVSIWRHGSAVNSGHQMGLYGEPCTRFQEEHPCE